VTDFIVSASATGSSGTGSLANPFTPSQATVNGGPGVRMLFRAGTYLRTSKLFINTGGAAGNPLIWQPYGDGDVVFLDNAANTVHNGFIALPTTASGGSANYVTFDGRPATAGGSTGTFEFNGNNYNSNIAIQTQDRHHITIRDCFMHHCGANGVECDDADYVWLINNRVWCCGHPSRTDGSGLSINAHQSTDVFDSYDGWHNIIAFNIVTGSEGEPSDGNGFIWDSGSTNVAIEVGNTLVYGNILGYNGNRGLHIFRVKPVAGGKILVANNTCLNNGLDLLTDTLQAGFGREFSIDAGSDNTGAADYANNFAYAVNDTPGPSTTHFGSTPYGVTGTPTIRSYNNYYTGGKSVLPWTTVAAGTLPTSIATPNLRGAIPAINTAASQAHLSAPDPRILAAVLSPNSNSGLIDAGIDPATVPGLTANMLADMASYLAVDLLGHTRPR
jgi:hypothetical protein